MVIRAIAVASLAIAAPAAAQSGPEPLTAPAGEAFRHAHSGLVFPAEVIGLKRAVGQEFVKPQLDIAFIYRSEDESEELSVYAYRVTTGSASLWFDVSRASVEQRESFGRKTPFGETIAFTPPGQPNPSALRQVWTLSDSPIRSTALVVIPMGEWLIKLRHSSRTSEAATLQRRTQEAIAALGWPSGIRATPDAAPLAACPDALALKGNSRATRTSGGSALLDAVMAQMEGGAEDKKGADPAEAARATRWCADRTTPSPVALFRPDGAQDRYLMALSDSGQAIWVRPGMASLLDAKARPSWTVSIVRAGDTINYPARDRLPPPRQIGKILDGGAATSVSTWGGRAISVDPARIK